MKKPIRLSIQWLILGLLAFAMLGTYAGSVISSVVVSRNNLEKNYLIENQYYAQKLAAVTDSLFVNMIKNLTMEARNEDLMTNDSRKIHKELDFILQSTTYFNSTFFADKTGRIVASAPDMALKGTKLTSVGAKKSLEKKVPIISKPYVGVTGKLILLISVPVFDESGSYEGFLAGTIYLHEDNSLIQVLGQHPKHENNSYVYVVDSEGNIIYHPDKNRINDNVKENKVVQYVLEGRNGNLEVTNTKGIAMLAGYASAVSTSKWGIVSQTPKESVMEPTFEMARQVSLIAILFMLFVFALSLIMLKKIVNPIRNLALYAKQMTTEPSRPVLQIPNWYFELKELKRAILIAVDFYQTKLTNAESESNLDPLTGFYNRRFLEKKISELDRYSIILFDIDHFKAVNDQFGHQAGDEVLKFLSELVKGETRASDLCFRIGGEEFLIILPETDIHITESVAERIRKITEYTLSPSGKPVTVSMGISSYPAAADSFSELLNKTDQALYKAKHEGRNRVVTAV